MPNTLCLQQKQMRRLLINAYRRFNDLDIFPHTPQDLYYAKNHIFRMNMIVGAHCRECDICNGREILQLLSTPKA